MIQSKNQFMMQENAGSVFEKGISSARASFEQVLKSPMAIREMNFEKCEYNIKNVDKSENFYAISSELIGDFIGESILVLSEQEVSQMIQKCLREEFWDTSSAGNQQMQDEFLKEVDNIASSAVVTDIANALEVLLISGTPKLHKLTAAELNTHIRYQASTYNSILHFKAIFQCEDMSISPNFIWMFNEQIVAKIAS